MGRQFFSGGPQLDPHVANATALVATTIEALWLGTSFTPIFANEPRAGAIYSVRAGGILSTSASASTLIISPFYGAVSSTILGASVAQTVPVSLTAQPWFLQFDLVIRTVGATGTAIGTGQFSCAGTAATAGSAFVTSFGGTSASIDTGANSGITIGKTLSVAGSMTTMYAYGFWRN